MTTQRQPMRALSVEGLRTLLREVLKKDEIMPSRADLTELARHLDGYRKLHLVNVEQWKPQAAAARKASQAARFLGTHLPKIRADAIASLPHFSSEPGFMIARIERDIAAMNAVESGLKYLLTESMALVPMTTAMAPSEKWRDLAVALSDAFVNALRPNNPHRIFGRSNDGPVPRFVSAIIPHVTGDAPTTLAVGKVLKDLRRTR